MVSKVASDATTVIAHRSAHLRFETKQTRPLEKMETGGTHTACIYRKSASSRASSSLFAFLTQHCRKDHRPRRLRNSGEDVHLRRSHLFAPPTRLRVFLSQSYNKHTVPRGSLPIVPEKPSSSKLEFIKASQRMCATAKTKVYTRSTNREGKLLGS